MINKENSTDSQGPRIDVEPVSPNAKRALDLQRKTLTNPEREAILHHLAECDE